MEEWNLSQAEGTATGGTLFRLVADRSHKSTSDDIAIALRETHFIKHHLRLPNFTGPGTSRGQPP